MNLHQEKIISLAREYVDNTKCTCHPQVCWCCLFEHNLYHLDAKAKKEAEKPERIIKAGKSGQEIIKVLESEIKDFERMRNNQSITISKLLDANERQTETIQAKQRHILALEKDIKRSREDKTGWAAVYERISNIGRKYRGV